MKKPARRSARASYTANRCLERGAFYFGALTPKAAIEASKGL